MSETSSDEDPHPLKKKINQNNARQGLIDKEVKEILGREVGAYPRRKFNELKLKKPKKSKKLLSTGQINCSQQAEINLHWTRKFLPQHQSYNFSTTQNYHYTNQLYQVNQQVNSSSMGHHYFGFSQSDLSSNFNEANMALNNFDYNESNPNLHIDNVSINQQQNDFNIPYKSNFKTYNPQQPDFTTFYNPYQPNFLFKGLQQSATYNPHQSNSLLSSLNIYDPQQPNNSTHVFSSISSSSKTTNNTDANLTDNLLNEIMEVIRSDETRSRSDPSNVFVKTCYVSIEESKTSQTLEQSSSNITGWRRIKYIFLVEKRWKKRKREQSYFLNKKN